jgi:hypothetical protein
VCFNLATPAFAQEDGNQRGQEKTRASKGEREKKKTKIDFEDELIEGAVKKPELFYLLEKKQFNFRRLINLRKDFLPEMHRDADEVRRTRSK